MYYRCKNGVLITFDDGPRKNITLEILDVLKDFNVPAVFFPVGKQIEALPDVTAKCIEQGHEIGNHSYFHDDPRRQNFNEFSADFFRTQNIILEMVGPATHPIYYRPPAGKIDLKLIYYWWRVDLSILFWSKTLIDYDPKIDSKIVIDRFKECGLAKGDILLLHETYGTLKALPYILNYVERHELQILKTEKAFNPSLD